MINKPIQILKLMYLALNKEWEKDKNELFGLYLSEADPFVVGNDSAGEFLPTYLFHHRLWSRILRRTLPFLHSGGTGMARHAFLH